MIVRQAILCLFLFFLLVFSFAPFSSFAVPEELFQLWQAHERWETAFENADIKAAESVWSHKSDVKMIDPMGLESVGWKKVREQLVLGFAVIKRSNLVTWDGVISVFSDKGSVTGKYILEGAFLNQTFSATELYRKENGQWKLYYDDAKGLKPPLFPEDEAAIKRLVAEVKWAYLGFDLSTLESLFAPSHRYLNSAGRSFCGREASIAALKEEQPSITLLHLDDIIIFLWQDGTTPLPPFERGTNLTAEATFQLRYQTKGETKNATGSLLFNQQASWKLVSTNLFGQTETEKPPWDVNCDGIVDISDLVLVGQHLGEENPSLIRADLNGDGVVDISDLVLIVRHFGGNY